MPMIAYMKNSIAMSRMTYGSAYIHTHDVSALHWRRGSVVRKSVFGWRTFPDLCMIYTVDMWPLCG